MTRVTETDVARRFSEILNRVAAGEEIEVTRAGAPVAVIMPCRVRVMDAHRFRNLLTTAPPVDEHFAEDVRAIRAQAGPPPNNSWPS